MTLKIAQRWFERKTFSDGITLLWEPHVHPMLRCNIWHVRGRTRDLLIDTGMGVASLRDAACDLFEKPLAAIATHSHLDHMGGLHEFDCRLCHAAEAALLANPSQSDRLNLQPDHWLALYMPDLDDSRLVIDALPYEGFDPLAWRLQPAPPTALLADGDLLDEIPGGDRAHYIRSLQRLCELPVQAVHAGHEGSFSGERLRALASVNLELWQRG